MSKYGIQKKGTGRALIKKPRTSSSMPAKRITGVKPFLPTHPSSPGNPFKPRLKKGGRVNTSRENRLEELGRVDAERAKTGRGKRNLKDEKTRIVRELKK